MRTRIYTDEQIREWATYMYERRTTIRDVANAYYVPKSVVHYHFVNTLDSIDPQLYYYIQQLMQHNLRMRSLRAADTTRRLYKGTKRKKN